MEKVSIQVLHERLVKGEMTCRELVQGYLNQIDRLNTEYNVFTDVCRDYALMKADEVDQKIKNGSEIGLLEGIPFSVKDSIATEHGFSQAGSNILKKYNSVFSATVVERLENVGAILIGKTNCDSFGHGSSTRNSDYGVTKNPYSKNHVAGGSSGGAGASVALNMCTFAIGEDTGGSIRQPASFCGVYGLKPSYGRVSRYGAIAYGSSLDTIGPLGNFLEDIELVMSVIAGKDEKDGTTYPGSFQFSIFNFQTDNEKDINTKKKIGIIREFMGEGLDERIRKLFDESVEKYRAQGFEIIEYSVPSIKYAIATYYLIACSESSSNLSRFDGVKYGPRAEAQSLEEMYTGTRGQGFSFETKKRVILGTYTLSAGYADKYYKKAASARALLKNELEKILSEVDVILSPTSPVLPYVIDASGFDPMQEYLADIYTVSPSLAGLCGLNVPIGMIDGLPVGMQIVGEVLGEEKLFVVAKIIKNN